MTMKFDSRKHLWNAVSALMHLKYGGENLNRLAREGMFSPATASRLKAQQTSVGLETIDRLAEYFDVEPYQLIDPDFNAHAPKLSSLSPMALHLAKELDSLENQVVFHKAYALALQAIEFGKPPKLPEPEPVATPDAPKRPGYPPKPIDSPWRHR